MRSAKATRNGPYPIKNPGKSGPTHHAGIQ